MPFSEKQLKSSSQSPSDQDASDGVLTSPASGEKGTEEALDKKTVAKMQEGAQRETLEAEQIYRKGVVSIRDVIAPAAMKVETTHLRLGQKYLRTVFVTTYPRYISIGWFAPIINFSAMLDIAMYFYPVKTAIVMKQLRNQVGVLEAQLSADAEKGAPRDPIRETALKDIEQLRDSLSQGTEKFFQFALYITLYGDTLEELEELTDDVELVFGSRLVMSRRVYFQTEQGYNSTMPLGNDELMVAANMNSSPAASSFPFISSDLTSAEGIMYGINRHNNSLIIFDRFSMQNANFTVFATSGAGKSYAIKLEVLRSLMQRIEVIIIDPEMEYKSLSDAVGGTYVNVSLSSEAKINPFDLPRAIGAEVETGDIIRSAVITMKGLLKLMLGTFTTKEDSLMDRALLETYAKKDITPESDLSTVEPPLVQDLYDILTGMEGADDIAMRLQKYTDGTFSGLFNSPTNVDMRNQLVIFSVRDLEDELRPIAIYSIVNYIWNVVRSEVKKRILVIDEAWWLMQNEDSAKFIFALVKRCRKYFLGVTTITQDVNDFLASPYGQAILNNSALQLLLKQAPSAVEVVRKTFMLTEGEKYLLLESGVGEGIFFAGQKHAAIAIKASYAEDQLITTDPRQLMEIDDAKKQFAEERAGKSLE
jgi:conjugal transfer ATP-binding protein TraC